MSHLTFATLLNQMLVEKDLSQADVARCLGVDKGTISRWAAPNSTLIPRRANIVSLRTCSFTADEVNRLLIAAGYGSLSSQESVVLPLDNDLKRYLEVVRNQQAVLDLSLFQEGQERDLAVVGLEEVYVPLRLTEQKPFTAGLANDSPGPKEDREHTRISILSTQLLHPKNQLGRRLTILGDAGSGKTTILRQLCGALAYARLKNDSALAYKWTGFRGRVDSLPVPLFISLPHYYHYCYSKARQSITRSSFLEFLPVYFWDRYGLKLELDFYHSLLTSGQSLLALDGFDEVFDPHLRRQVLEVVRSLATDSETGRNLIILSSRIAAYGGRTQLGGNFKTLWVQNLNLGERVGQIQKWTEYISQWVKRPLKAEEVLSRMPEGSPLDQLALTPMIVTAICLVYFYHYELPEQRARLYRRCVDIMLDEGFRLDEPGRELANMEGGLDLKRELLARLAFELHRTRKEGINREQAARCLKDGLKTKKNWLQAARDFLDFVASRGILLQERDGQFGFGEQYLVFQAFLSGYHLSRNLGSPQRQELWPSLVMDHYWHEPIRLAIGATMPENSLACEEALAELLNFSEAATDPAARLTGYRLAAEALWDLGEGGRLQIEEELKERIQQRLGVHLAEKGVASSASKLLPARAAAALALSRLAEPYREVRTLPPQLTSVLTGEFMYNEKKEPSLVAPFQAGVYLVTNAQFAQFVPEGYERLNLWSEAGQAWLKNPPHYRGRPVRQPEYWEDERFNQADQPVVGVSWYEAEAFCNWLSATYKRIYRLPTELEWERLARGQSGHDYPWGNSWQEGVANTVECGLGQTTVVWLFHEGVSPAGGYDCAGNVWEWCSNWFDEEEQVRVLRGGSWLINKDHVRCPFRDRGYPDGSNNNVGFRVVSPI